MAHIDYYFSTISPWTYLAGDRLERIAGKHGATITYRPLDVLQLFDRTGGVRPQARHESRMAYRTQELARWAEHLGMPLLPRAPGATNMAPSSYAIIAAQQAVADGKGGDLPGLVQSILRAHFAEDRDITDDATLRELLGAAGFEPGLVDSGLFLGAETYARNLEDAVAAGVFGAPFYLVDDGAKFWGQDRLDFLDRHLAAL